MPMRGEGGQMRIMQKRGPDFGANLTPGKRGGRKQGLGREPQPGLQVSESCLTHLGA